MLFNDTLWSDLESDDSVPVSKVQQRFSLAVFYFGAGGGISWESTWLEGDECEGWEYLNCDNDGNVRAIFFGKY